MKPVSKDSSSIADKTAQPTTGIANWELKELFWSKSAYEVKETPKQHYAWAVSGDDIYLSPIHSEAQARLIYAAPELLDALYSAKAAIEKQMTIRFIGQLEDALCQINSAIAKASIS